MQDKENLDYLGDRRDSHLLSLMYRRARETQYIDDATSNTRRADSPLYSKVSKPPTKKLKDQATKVVLCETTYQPKSEQHPPTRIQERVKSTLRSQ